VTVVTVVPETAILDGRDRLVVAEAHGRLALAEPGLFTSEGEVVRGGDVIARITADGHSVTVCAPCDAWVMGYLVGDGERVQPGSAIAHLRAL
jgi:biotin carboxyl carrier protein